MATIRKRSNGTFQFTVSLGRDLSGKQIREYKTYVPTAKTPGSIQKEVEKAAVLFEQEVREGKYLSGEKLTFEEFHQKYYKPQWATRNLTPSIQEKYEWYVTRYGYPTLRALKISRIRPLHIQTIIDSMEQQGLSPQSIRHAHTAINSVFRYAHRTQIIDTNPAERAELPRKEADVALHYFTKDQALAFLDFIGKPHTSTTTAHDRTDDTGKVYHVGQYTATYDTAFQFRVLFDLAIRGGFRRGELVALQWRDISFEDSTISVYRAVAKRKGEQYLKEPKSKKSIRTVTMPKESMDLLREWKQQQRELCLSLGSQWKGKRGKEFDWNFVFIQMENGNQMFVDTPSQKFHKLLLRYNAMIDAQIKNGTATEEDKLPLIRFHDLRHTAATLLVAAGLDIETIAARLGHSRVSITLDRYAHALPENDKKAAEVLERIFAR